MKETIKSITKSKAKGKKYKAVVMDQNTKKSRTIQFGAVGYQQFKDSTPVKAYASKNHGDRERRRRYFLRHSGVVSKDAALKKEIRKSGGKYTAKILSHRYLW